MGQSTLKGKSGDAALFTRPISLRESQIAQGLLKGLSYKEIANALSLSPKTVETHITNVYRKAGVTNAVGLLWALAGEEVRQEIARRLEKETEPREQKRGEWVYVFRRDKKR